jgi:hypothetical protein
MKLHESHKLTTGGVVPEVAQCFFVGDAAGRTKGWAKGMAKVHQASGVGRRASGVGRWALGVGRWASALTLSISTILRSN